MAAGSFANGSGNLTLTITGTPSISAGNNVTASFAINIGGRLCTFTVEVAPTTVSCSRYIGSTSGSACYLFGPAGKNNYYECFRYSNNTLVLLNYTCSAGSLWNGGGYGFGSVPIGTSTTGKCVIQ
ncbi:hypothetical protein [Chryseobacterium sp. MA9]|uniref:hypothetical protein n=1 Tax=Chryseobacterium sp. MA9 TaxID=2966625 RepID=UPI002107025C|nr:hypothetical protein [Chryseobacterium sp. MA9]UTX48907.1 hypothetical protein KIK00_01160 [Chryseobacterium sp. MA9]